MYPAVFVSIWVLTHKTYLEKTDRMAASSQKTSSPNLAPSAGWNVARIPSIPVTDVHVWNSSRLMVEVLVRSAGLLFLIELKFCVKKHCR